MSYRGKRDQRCKFFNADGTPKGNGCPRSTQQCMFLHPTEPAWATARGWIERDGGGRSNPPPTRAAFNEPRDSDTGWGKHTKRDFSASASGAKPTTESGGWESASWDPPPASGIDTWAAPSSSKKDDSHTTGETDAWGQPLKAFGSGWDQPAEPTGWDQPAEPSSWNIGNTSASGDGGWPTAANTADSSKATAGSSAWAVSDAATGSAEWGPVSPTSKTETPVSGWHETGADKGKASISAWDQSDGSTERPSDAMNTDDSIAGIDTWGSHHAAAPSRMPDMVHRSSSGLQQDPDRQDAMSSPTRVSRSERGKQGSDRDDRSTHHSQHATSVPPYEIPVHELSNIHALFVAAVEATRELHEAEAAYEPLMKSLKSQVYSRNNTSPQAYRIISTKKAKAQADLAKARNKNQAYLDALEAFESTPDPDLVTVDPEQQAALDYLLGQVTPWLHEQNERIQQAHARLDKLLDVQDNADDTDTSPSTSTVSKRQRVFAPEMEAQIQARREEIEEDDQTLALLMQYLDVTFPSQLEDAVTAELEKFQPEEGQVVDGTLVEAEEKHAELVKGAETLLASFEQWQENGTARTEVKNTLLDLEDQLKQLCATLDEQRALTENAWNELEDGLTEFDTSLQSFTVSSERLAAVVAASEAHIETHFKEHTEPAFEKLETQLSTRFRDQLDLILKAVEEHIVPAERWFTAQQAKPAGGS